MILLTHKSCLDGFASQVVFKHLINQSDSSKIFELNYSELETIPSILRENATKDEDIYIVDLNYKKIEEIQYLKKEFDNLVYIDHHTYEDHYYNEKDNDDSYILYKNKKGKKWLYCPKTNTSSGAKLFYEFAKENGLLIKLDRKSKLEDFITMASDYDTWMWKKRDKVQGLYSQNLAQLYQNVPREIFSDSVYNYISGKKRLFNDYATFLNILEKKKNQSYDVISNECQISKDSNGYTYIWLQMESADSILMNKLLEDERYAGVDYVVCFSTSKKTLSFRSRAEFDVAEIARKYGGGGHKNAAGCGIPEPFLKNYKI